MLEVKEIISIPNKITSIPLSNPKCLGIFQVRDSLYSLKGKTLDTYAKEAVVIVNLKGEGIIVDEFSLKGDEQVQEIDFLKAQELI